MGLRGLTCTKWKKALTEHAESRERRRSSESYRQLFYAPASAVAYLKRAGGARASMSACVRVCVRVRTCVCAHAYVCACVGRHGLRIPLCASLCACVTFGSGSGR